MEGSGHLFQLDEDDIFSSDSFLEELEEAEKVECVVLNPKQTPSYHGPQQNSFSKSNHAAPSMPTPRPASSLIPQAKTPISGEGRKFSFKSKTSPEIPLPPDFGNHKQRDSPIIIGEKIGVGGNQNNGLVRSNISCESNTSRSRMGLVAPESSTKNDKLPPQNVTKIPSPLANLRQLNSNRFKPDKGTSNQASEVRKQSVGNASSDVLDTSLGDFREPPGRTGSHKSVGMLRPVGSAAQNIRHQVSKKEVVGDSAGTSGNLGTPGQSSWIVEKQMMRSPPQRPNPPHHQDTSRTTHKPSCTPLSSKVNSISHDGYSNSATINTPTPGSNFRGRQTGPTVQQRNQNAAQSPNAGSGCISPGYNQRGNASSTMQTPQSRIGVSSYDQTPPPRSHHDPRYGISNGNRNTTPVNSVRTPTMHGRGGHNPGMGHTHQQHTPVMGHPQQQHTPAMGHAQRQHTPVNRPLPNQRQTTPGQPARPVLTPRVAHLCKGSGPSPGAGAVHGGTRKFPGPAGMLPKLTPGQKLKDAAAALKKKVEEEELSQEAEESSEEVADVGDFEHGAWFRMKTELGIKDQDSNSILQQNSIALVIRKASLKQLTKNKVNRLCVMIKTISLNSSDASVTLCDPSGEMQGTIHRRLIEEHQGDLRQGSVLVLRQVGVLSPSQRNHYLNITPSNLIQVFAGESTSRPGSQKTPKRSRKRSGKTPSRRKHLSETVSPGCRTEPSAMDKSPAASRRPADEKGLGLGVAPDLVSMDTDNYVEDDDAGIWEEMLDDDEDVLIQDSQVGENDTWSRLDTKEEEPSANSNAMYAQKFHEVSHTKSSASSSSKPATTQNSLAQRPSPNLSTTVNTTALSPLTTTTSSASSSRMLPLATKRCHPVPSKPTPSTLGNLEEMKRPCLREISGLGSNTGGGNQTGGSNKGQKPALNSCREESIGDLLDGLEDELFDDF